MAFPLAAVFLVGGAAVAVAASSSSKGRTVDTIKRLPTGARGVPAIKFMDSRYDCTRGEPGWKPYVQSNRFSDLIPYLSGYEYLASVPSNASARVAAMRLKIRSTASASRVQSMVEGSKLGLYKVARDIYDSAQTPSGRLALANKMGVPVSQINGALNDVSGVIAKYAGDTAALYMRELVQYGSDYVVKLIRDYAIKVVSEMTSSAAGAAVAESIPIIGQMLQMYTKMAGLAYDMKNAEYQALCNDWIESFKSGMSKLTSYGFPIPWNMMNNLSPACRDYEGVKGVFGAADKWTPTLDQTILLNIVTAWFKQFRALEPKYMSAITKWWTYATMMMSDPRVGDVFSAMCMDSLGGTIASDEQVMVVAAPIAVMYGLDVDAFAVRLYESASGWVEFPSNMRSATQIDKAIYKCGGGVFASGCDITGFESICKNVVINCFVLNLANLTTTAFPLAEKMKRDGVGLAKDKKPSGIVKPVLVMSS